MRLRQSTLVMVRASTTLLFRSTFVLGLFAMGGVRITERWYLDHMGAMAFWRTVIGMANPHSPCLWS